MNVRFITTTYNNDVKETTETIGTLISDPGVEMQVVNLYPEVEYQTFDGFGAAITDAAGYTFSKMSAEKQGQIVEAYFGEAGNNYSLIRTHIDSCDFSLDQYEAMSDKEDREFKSFSLERDEAYILPMVKAAEEKHRNPLSVMLSPWSPPSFMKTNGQRVHGGSLKSEYREFWADYISHYIEKYREKGVAVEMLTIQNEPNATQTWDSCLYNGEEEKVFLRDYLYPSLQKRGLGDVEVLVWDHNKERMYERACEIIDDETDKMVQGIAFHWYTGEHFDAIRLVREKFPDKKLIFTEGCVEYSRFSEVGQLQNAQMYAHDIIGNINAGMNAFIDWNIILDKQGGPNHVANYCDAPIMCDTENDLVQEKLSFTYIGHFSKYIQPGAKVIASTKYTDKLSVVAAKNPDGTIVSVYLNKSNESIPVAIRVQGQATNMVVPAESIVTGILE